MHDAITALTLGVRIGLIGWLWTPSMPRSVSSSGGKGFIGMAGRAIGIGLVMNLLPALCAAQASLWSAGVDWLIWGILVTLGAFRCVRGHRVIDFREMALLVSLIAALSFLTLALPPRSEWIAGGWDPGLYQNYAVAVSRGDGFKDIAGTVYERLTPDERALFGAEVLPGVPLDHESGALQHYFFQLMPMCGAFLFRIGGLPLLVRINQLLALLSLPAVWAFFSGLGLRGWRLFWPLAVWCVSPVWWYHQAVPTSEMLQLLLLLSAFTLYLDAFEKEDHRPVWVAVMLAAMGINHFGFPALLSLMLVVATAAESIVARAGRSGRWIVCALGLAAGLAWDLVFSRVTLIHLQAKDQAISLVLAVVGISFALSCIIDRKGLVLRLRRWAGPAVKWGALLFGCLLVTASILTYSKSASDLMHQFGRDPSLLQGLLLRFKGICEFMDPLWPFLLGFGAVGVALGSGKESHKIKVAACGIGGIMFALILNPGIAPFYPWALRRYMVFLIPSAAIAIGCGLPVLLQSVLARTGARTAKVAAACCVCVVLAFGAKSSRKAAQVGDYVGYIEVLQKLNTGIEQGDVIVADDARIATPLLLALGRDVLDGAVLWKSKDESFVELYHAMLDRLVREEGLRVLWLTSTDEGLGIYSGRPINALPLYAPIRSSHDTVIHSARADRFACRKNHRTFQLYVQD